MSRIGKIARLPLGVREELNERLLDGEPQGQLVAWLNGRDEVQAVLKAHYDGRPINDQNLSAWVQGGFEDWKRQQASLEVASRFVEDSAAVAEVMTKGAGTGGPKTEDREQRSEGLADGLLAGLVSDRVAMMAALAIGELLMATRRMEDGAEKRGAILKIIRGLVRLRNTDRQRERGEREAAQAERAAEMHAVWAASRPARSTGSGSPDGTQAKRSVWSGAEETAGGPASQRGSRTDEDEALESEEAGDGTGAEHEHEQEHEHEPGDVRGRMAEIIARMSDAEIAESLRRSGYTQGREPSFAEPTAGRRPADGGAVNSEMVGGETVDGGPSTSTSMSGKTAAEGGYSSGALDEETKRRLAPNGKPEDWVFLGRPAGSERRRGPGDSR